VAWAHREQAALYRRFLTFFEEFDVLVAPAASVSPFPHAQLFVEEIDGQAMPTYMRWLAISYAPTLAFGCAAAIPCGLDAHGMPFGIQIIGPKGSDRKVIAAALAMEARLARDPASARPLPDLKALS
jgi:Asp-tRNA(Asn)/Glu-tRNA(Gln) amidotransferase A subunit family amidase